MFLNLTSLCLRSMNRAMRQNIVQKDRQAQPTDSGSAAAIPTLLYALGRVSMICPTCGVAGSIHAVRVCHHGVLLSQ